MLFRLTDLFLKLLLFSSLLSSAYAQSEQVNVSLISKKLAEDYYNVGIKFDIKKDWHIYWKYSGESGAPTKVKWLLSGDANSSKHLSWPTPEVFIERGNITTYGYANEVALLTDIETSNLNNIKAKVSWLACKDICIPGSTEVSHEDIKGSDELISRYNKKPEFPPLSLERSIVKKIKNANENFFLIKLAGLGSLEKKKIEKIEQHIQFFPLNENVKNNPQINSEGWLKLSLANNKKAEGFIAFSKELAGNKNDTAIYIDMYSLITKDSDDSKIKQDFKNLTFRKHSRAEKVNIVKQSSAPLYLSLIYAFIGGLILNLMPCVLPIISIKVLSFVENADKSQKAIKKSAYGFCAGILSSFLALATAVTLLRKSGQSLGWGFQFHHPEFVFILIIILFILALGFFDIYTIGISSLSKAGKKIDKLEKSFFRDFLDGILATALSTPCSAPFLGVALLAAFTKGTKETFLIFIAIGLGLALPYYFLSTNPKLLSLLPKPGNWMYRFKHLMGFLLLATLIWLLFVLNNLIPISAFWTLCVLLIIYILFWLRSWQKESKTSFNKLSFTFAYVLSFIAILFLMPKIFTTLDTSKKIDWKTYSPELVSELTQNGKSVFIDFTADWCVTCKANELYTISSSKVVNSLEEKNITAIKADWTKADPVITEALNRYGAKGVPLYVVISGFDPENPNVLPTVITPNILVKAFEDASL